MASTKKPAKKPAKKGPPKGVQREGGDAGTKGTGSAGRVKSGAKKGGR